MQCPATKKNKEDPSKIDGNTTIELQLKDDNTHLTFKLKDKRKIDHKLINSLKIKENIVID